jgi:hypothetical protein
MQLSVEKCHDDKRPIQLSEEKYTRKVQNSESDKIYLEARASLKGSLSLTQSFTHSFWGAFQPVYS